VPSFICLSCGWRVATSISPCTGDSIDITSVPNQG
jgi:hypothetical protein